MCIGVIFTRGWNGRVVKLTIQFHLVSNLGMSDALPVHSSLCFDVKVKAKGKFVTVLLTEHHAMKSYWGSGSIAPHILDLGTRWK